MKIAVFALLGGALASNQLVAQKCDGSKNQKWTWRSDGGLESVGMTGKCISATSSGGGEVDSMELVDCSGDASLKWAYNSSRTHWEATGVVVPCKATGSPKGSTCMQCMDLAGVIVDPWDCKDPSAGEQGNQYWSSIGGDGSIKHLSDPSLCVTASGPPPPPSPGTPLPIDPNGGGWTWEGLGGLSNSNGPWLRDYPPSVLSEILDLMFLPRYGASFPTLKVEIGGGGGSTIVTESSYANTRKEMESGEFVVARGWENWLIEEALKRNPDMLLYGLAWTAPGWLCGNTTFYCQDTAEYLANWVVGVEKSIAGARFKYLGIHNESGDPPAWFIILLRQILDAAGLQHTGIVVADTHDFSIADEIGNDTSSEIWKAVEAIGVHEPLRDAETLPANAIATGKRVLASESYTTYADNNGGGCWVREQSWGNLNNVTAYWAWNLVQSYPFFFPYIGHGLFWAAEPWSGHYCLNPPLLLSPHFTWFVDIGDPMVVAGRGSGYLPQGGAYTSYLKPSSPSDFTLVVQTLEHNNSMCFKDSHPEFTVANTQTVTFAPLGSLAKPHQTLALWTSYLFPNDDPCNPQHSHYFQRQSDITTSANGSFQLTLQKNMVVTVTTDLTGSTPTYSTPPPSAPFPKSFAHSLVVPTPGARAPYFLDTIGVFEGAPDPTDPTTSVISQVLPQPDKPWHLSDQQSYPYTLLGGANWTVGQVNVSVRPAQGGWGGLGIGLNHFVASGNTIQVFPNGTTILTPVQGTTKTVQVSPPSDGWFQISLTTTNTTLQATIQNTVIGPISSQIRVGFPALYSSFDPTPFRNLSYSFEW